MEVGIDSAGLATKVADGDIVRVYSIVSAYRKSIVLRGDVANPGRFGWHEGMRLSELIPDKDSLMSRDYWWKRSHLGLPSPEFEPLVSKIGRDLNARNSDREAFTPAASQDALTRALTPEPNDRDQSPTDQEDFKRLPSTAIRRSAGFGKPAKPKQGNNRWLNSFAGSGQRKSFRPANNLRSHRSLKAAASRAAHGSASYRS